MRPVASPAPYNLRKESRTAVATLTNRNRTATVSASCGLYRLLEEAGHWAALFFETNPARDFDLQTTAPITDDPLGWFLDIPMAISSPPTSIRDSPTSVSAPLPPSPVEQEYPSILQLSAHALALIYDSIASVRAWDTEFMRGPRSRHGMRRLATAHLYEEGTDGWNVVAGALELARAWAIRTTSDVDISSTSKPHRLDRNTRLRLAVCLNLSWKFQRSCCSCFMRTFRDIGEFHGWPDVVDGHTRELAYIGYAFLFPSEQDAFGQFSDANRNRVQELYQTMLKLEVELLTSVPSFSLLTDNVQMRAELLLETFYLEKKMTSAVSLSARSILPFFLRAAISNGTYEDLTLDVEHGAQAIVCAASFCVAVSAPPSVCARHPPRFETEVRQEALALLHAALVHSSGAYLRHGCFGDESWPTHVLVDEETLRRASVALRSSGVR